MSSGERAILNLFSWIVFLPQYRKIRYGKLGGLRDNILLLIDELDLYCHPAWQQKLIYYLLEELKTQFASTDYIFVKCYEACLVDKTIDEYDFETLHAERQSLRDQINQLETELSVLESE